MHWCIFLLAVLSQAVANVIYSYPACKDSCKVDEVCVDNTKPKCRTIEVYKGLHALQLHAYKSASYYWPLSSITEIKDRKYFVPKNYSDGALVFSNTKKSNSFLQLDTNKVAVLLGVYEDNCLSNILRCTNGVMFAFWLRVHHSVPNDKIIDLVTFVGLNGLSSFKIIFQNGHAGRIGHLIHGNTYEFVNITRGYWFHYLIEINIKQERENVYVNGERKQLTRENLQLPRTNIPAEEHSIILGQWATPKDLRSYDGPIVDYDEFLIFKDTYWRHFVAGLSKTCPIVGKWSSWGAWSACTRKCDSGSKYRYRQCKRPHGSCACIGRPYESQQCNSQPCACGGTLKGESGVITSPGYPRRYPNNRICNWTIEVPKDKVVSLQFLSFDIEKHSSCSYDYLEIQDGVGNTSPKAARYCNEMPIYVFAPVDGKWSSWEAWSACTKKCGRGSKSRSRQCNSPAPRFDGKTCKGKSNEEQECNSDPCAIDGKWSSWEAWSVCSKKCGRGSKSRSRQCNSPTPRYGGKTCKGKPNEEQECNSDPCATCGGTLIGESGVLTSPGYPQKYPNNKNCEWTIEVPRNKVVSLQFLLFDIEKHSSCSYDYLEIQDGVGNTSPKAARYCNEIPIYDWQSNQNKVRIKFVTDYSEVRDGFKLEWRAVSKKVAKEKSARCPLGWKFFPDTLNGPACYISKDNFLSWDRAREDCLTNSADLVSITSRAEHEFVSRQLLKRRLTWIGFTDKEDEGRWAWSDNTTKKTFTNWAAGDPNDGGWRKNEDCALMKHDGKWNDYPCDHRAGYICKRKTLN